MILTYHRVRCFIASWLWQVRDQEMLWACGYNHEGDFIRVSYVFSPTHKDAPKLRRQFAEYVKEQELKSNVEQEV